MASVRPFYYVLWDEESGVEKLCTVSAAQVEIMAGLPVVIMCEAVYRAKFPNVTVVNEYRVVEETDA